jgi:16S rRNA (uracil1498-N3)-methyltransferase
MHRFYLPPEQCRDSLLRLEDREAHHALHVLRIRCGDHVIVLDGAGTELLCEVREADRRHLGLAVVKKTTAPPLPSQITLLQALPKGKIIESIIQKATELGVARIVPILSERVVTHLDQEDGVQKAEKWQQVAIEAIKQCGSPWLPRVEPPVTSKQFCARKEKIELPLIASLREKHRRPRGYFEGFQSKHHRPPASIGIWIGPEGDFSDAEVDAIMAEGALPITLGNLVLRVETAATYCLSVLNNELADLSPEART